MVGQFSLPQEISLKQNEEMCKEIALEIQNHGRFPSGYEEKTNHDDSTAAAKFIQDAYMDDALNWTQKLYPLMFSYNTKQLPNMKDPQEEDEEEEIEEHEIALLQTRD
jgi:hypothetical protein